MQDNFKVGDIVSYNYSIAWSGGKGKVTEVNETDQTCKVQSIEIPAGVHGTYTNGDLSSWHFSYLKPFQTEAVEHPAHHGGGDNPYEVIKVAEAWGLDKDSYLFNVVKYVARAGKKDAAKELEDLKKAKFFLDRKLKRLEEAAKA